jgi:hypothetical protein
MTLIPQAILSSMGVNASFKNVRPQNVGADFYLTRCAKNR